MRLPRIEAFRVYAMFLIVFVHSQVRVLHAPLLAEGYKFCLYALVRATMPFFFIVSGYFLGGKMTESEGKAVPIAKRYTVRLFAYFLVWWVFYLFETPLLEEGFTYGMIRPAYWIFRRMMASEPINFLMGGARIHLWFLTTLIATVWAYVLFGLTGKRRYFMHFGIAMYLFGLIAGPYKIIPVGIDLYFTQGLYVVYSLLFFSIGVALQQNMPRIGVKGAWGIFVVGLAVYGTETYVLWHTWGLPQAKNDFGLGMIPLGIGAFLLAVKQQASRLDTIVGTYGRYMLGVYLCHFLFIDLLDLLKDIFPPVLWQILLLPFLCFAVSLLATIAYYRVVSVVQKRVAPRLNPTGANL